MTLNRFRKIISLCSLVICAGASRAQTLEWGNEVFGSIVDSNGMPLDETFIFELGAFEDGFTPTSSNTSEWMGHWKAFDRAVFNALIGYFASSVQMRPDGTSSSEWMTPDAGTFEGLEAYLFIRNGNVPLPMTEWLLARAAGWSFPSAQQDCCPNRLPIQWAVSDLGSEAPVFGGQSGISGGGAVFAPGVYDLQTYTFVPEPSGILLLVFGAWVVAGRRRR